MNTQEALILACIAAALLLILPSCNTDAHLISTPYIDRDFDLPFEEMRQAFDRRRVVMHEMLSTMPGIESPEPEGAFYAFPSVEGLIGKTIAGKAIGSSMELAAVLLEEAKVAVAPGIGFGESGEGYVRFALVENRHRIRQAVRGIRRFLRTPAS